MSSKKTSSQLVSDSKATIEEVCIGRLLSLKAIIAFISKTKGKYDANGTVDWQGIVGHFADANTTKKKITKTNGAKRDGGQNAKQKDGRMTNSKSSPEQKKAAKSKDKSMTPVAHKSPKIKSPATKPSKNKKVEEMDGISEEPAATTTVDPFFITNDGSNYVSTAVIDRTQADGPDDTLNRRSRRANRLSNNSAGPKAHAKVGQFNKSAPILKTFGGSSRNTMRKDEPENVDADVHPSWSAKRKQKSIPAFQGKKMKFDGEKSTTDTTKPANSGEVSSKLHPSWVAKQKLKPVITEFKGSKITFD